MIEFKNVSKIYPSGVKGLDDVNLTVNDGDFLCIIGLSGAGKSTLLRSINKMHTIQSGNIIVNDEDISKAKGKKLRLIRRNIGMIFQSFNLVNRSSVYKNVLAGRVGYHSTFSTLFGIYSRDEKMLALQSLDKLGILDKAFIRADQLSGGQQQRVALARALTQEPKIILADEPVASLDPVTTISVMDDFAKINREFGITIVANMHHVDLAMKYANRIIGIKSGKIVFDGTPDEITDEVLFNIYGRALKHSEKLGEVDDAN
ncbi:MAG: phosphonate ABC transporter ATP-binding protein [Erysipelotrichaceae bacterium]|jgi:phosphonate transport system ATP-binding protein|nr:phosphonate ABC transporter ATP-binding protein [Erysipelotrichaceae bacterium]MCB9499723.1 phosphonate ABC transporter ATP-binding protein [Erysipelotrichaceae bacterium]